MELFELKFHLVNSILTFGRFKKLKKMKTLDKKLINKKPNYEPAVGGNFLSDHLNGKQNQKKT